MFELYTFSNGSPYCLIHKTRFCFTKKQIITPYIFLIKFLYGDIRIFSRYRADALQFPGPLKSIYL